MKITKIAGEKFKATPEDIYEGVRFYDPRTYRGSHTGKLVLNEMYGGKVWAMLYDDGHIEMLTNGDLERIEKA